jgi:hypothetical protein
MVGSFDLCVHGRSTSFLCVRGLLQIQLDALFRYRYVSHKKYFVDAVFEILFDTF